MIITTINTINTELFLREGVKKIAVFFGRPFPNLFTRPPTPGFLWDLGKRKVKFGSKRVIFGVIWVFFWGVWTLFGNQPPHPHLGKISKKKRFFFTPSLITKKSLCSWSIYNANKYHKSNGRWNGHWSRRPWGFQNVGCSSKHAGFLLHCNFVLLYGKNTFFWNT